jgi:hypothetical protein
MRSFGRKLRCASFAPHSFNVGHQVRQLHRENDMSNKWVLSFLLASMFVLGGCATPMNYVATGGSRSDGTVKLSYQYGGFQQPVVDAQQGLDLAKSKCAAWGFTGAEAFGGEVRTCTAYNQYGCVQFLVTAEYQCLGSPSK